MKRKLAFNLKNIAKLVNYRKIIHLVCYYSRKREKTPLNIKI